MYYSTSNNIMIFDKTLDLAVVSNRSIRPIGNHGGCHRHLLSDGSTGSDYNETFPKLCPHQLKGVSLQQLNLKLLTFWKKYDKILNFITYYPREKKIDNTLHENMESNQIKLRIMNLEKCLQVWVLYFPLEDKLMWAGHWPMLRKFGLSVTDQKK